MDTDSDKQVGKVAMPSLLFCPASAAALPRAILISADFLRVAGFSHNSLSLT